MFGFYDLKKHNTTQHFVFCSGVLAFLSLSFLLTKTKISSFFSFFYLRKQQPSLVLVLVWIQSPACALWVVMFAAAVANQRWEVSIIAASKPLTPLLPPSSPPSLVSSHPLLLLKYNSFFYFFVSRSVSVCFARRWNWFLRFCLNSIRITAIVFFFVW